MSHSETINSIVCVLAAIFFGLLLIARSATMRHEREEEKGHAARVAAMARMASATRAQGGRPLSALITGANSGIGLQLAHILGRAGLRVYMACRSASRGEAAVQQITSRFPGADVRFLLLDVADPLSVRAAAASLPPLDFVFLNAGIMPIETQRWSVPLCALLSCNLRYFLETGRGSKTGPHFLAQPPDELLACGAPSLFATHVLGHALLVEELRASGRLAFSRSPDSTLPASAAFPASTRIVWTSSRAASAPMLSWENLMPTPLASSAAAADARVHGETYGEAKHAQDLYNAAIGRRGYSCISTCPGSVDSGVMPGFFKPALPLLWVLRAYLPGFNLTAERGAYVLLAAALQADSLRPDVKYVLWGGGLRPTTAAVWPLSLADQERMHALVQQWLALWREHAAASERSELGSASELRGASSPLRSGKRARATRS